MGGLAGVSAPMAARRPGWSAATTRWPSGSRAFHAAGIETFMLQFQPFEAEMRRFAEQIIPRTR